ncbi:MAG: hypothetical protein Ta2A_22130 [Treponemataceae bacterium]|nr:MAG: hypothetical protein Ta2A_22130 [Treponemataceae bacterium]
MQIHTKNQAFVFAVFVVVFSIIFGGFSSAQEAKITAAKNVEVKISVGHVYDAELSRFAEFFAAELIAHNNVWQSKLKNNTVKIEITERSYMEKISFKNSVSGIVCIFDADGKMIQSGSIFSDGNRTVISASYLRKIIKSLIQSIEYKSIE